MPGTPSARKPNPLLLRLIGEAAARAAKDHPDSRMQQVSDRALRLAQKAMREGKAGVVTDDEGNMAIVEK